MALTIPARVIIGILTDRFGPRIVYSALLVVMSLPCFVFAFAESYTQLAIARFALGAIGARMAVVPSTRRHDFTIDDERYLCGFGAVVYLRGVFSVEG